MFNRHSKTFQELEQHHSIEDCFYLCDYFPYSDWDFYESIGVLNEIGKDNSKIIMDLKYEPNLGDEEWRYQKKQRAINAIITCLLDLLSIDKNVCVCVVPSSKKNNQYHGITLVAKDLCKYRDNVEDGLDIIDKLYDTPQLHGNKGNRDYANLKKSLSINTDLFRKDILLLDDIITTGQSVRIVKDLLIKNNANKVYTLAVGKTFYL